MDEENNSSDLTPYQIAARNVMKDMAARVGLTIEDYKDRLNIGFEEFYD